MFALWWSVLRYDFYSIKRYLMIPSPPPKKNNLDMPHVKSPHMHSTYKPKFGLSLYVKPYWSYGPIWENYTEWTQNYIDCLTCIFEAQNFVCFTLRWADFQVRPNFDKVHWRTPRRSWYVRSQKIPCAFLVYPPRTNFRLFHSTMTPQNDFDMFVRWAVF